MFWIPKHNLPIIFIDGLFTSQMIILITIWLRFNYSFNHSRLNIFLFNKVLKGFQINIIYIYILMDIFMDISNKPKTKQNYRSDQNYEIKFIETQISKFNNKEISGMLFIINVSHTLFYLYLYILTVQLYCYKIII